jgi:hypothetical protein
VAAPRTAKKKKRRRAGRIEVDPNLKFDGALRIVGATDPKAIAAILADVPDSKWHEHVFRQEKYEQATHQYTHTIYVKYKGEGRTILDEELHERLTPTLQLMRRSFRNFYRVPKVPIRRIIFTRLQPHKGIPKHRDSGWFLEHHRRIHIPIVTHPDIRFRAGDHWQHLAPGTLYELNNQRPHAVRNPTDVARIHMIVDIMTDPEHD